MAKRIITINRMFGSNGRLIGKTLAENLDIGFYDKELIDMAAKKNNIPFDTLAKVDEKKASQWVFPVDSELQFTDNFSFVPMNDVLYDLQRKIILSLPQKEDCVIVGRCADAILEGSADLLKVFVHADFEKRAKRIVEKYGETEEPTEKRLRDKDKRRALYYQFYTDLEWGNMNHYHIILDSGSLGIEKCVDVIASLY